MGSKTNKHLTRPCYLYLQQPVIRVASQRAESDEFSIFSAHIVDPTDETITEKGYSYSPASLVTSIRGDRTLLHNGPAVLQGSTQVTSPLHLLRIFSEFL